MNLKKRIYREIRNWETYIQLLSEGSYLAEDWSFSSIDDQMAYYQQRLTECKEALKTCA